ncbi:MAG: hypothetical protein WC343_01860 [Bacilli bacterium]|jgi:5'(3')-deoxyribonucleotidase
MYFEEKIKQILNGRKGILFVDMDGVIADYELNIPLDFKAKRPLLSSIKKLENISLMNNIELHILSVCKTDDQITDKNNWLDKYAPFFKKENRVIISKESHPNIASKNLKLNYLILFAKERKEIIMMIDDDNGVLKHLASSLDNVILFQDSSLID